MTYHEFNKRVLEFYISRSVSGYCILSLDAVELNSIIDPATLIGFTNLRHSWDGLLAEVDGIPQYFGLVAIQCFAASLMEREEQVAASAYQLRLIRLLGICDENELQNLFRGKTAPQPAQELIWEQAKKLFSNQVKPAARYPRSDDTCRKVCTIPKVARAIEYRRIKTLYRVFQYGIPRG